MLGLVGCLAHALYAPILYELLDRLHVDFQVTERAAVLEAGSNDSPVKVDMVRGADQEYAFTVGIYQYTTF